MTMQGGAVRGVETGIGVLDDSAVFMADVCVEQCEEGSCVCVCLRVYVYIYIYIYNVSVCAYLCACACMLCLLCGPWFSFIHD